MQLKSSGYIGIASPNYKVWEELGPSVFGFGLAQTDSEDSVFLRLDDRHHRIAVHRGDHDCLSYLGWEVAGEREVDTAAEELLAAGLPAVEGTAEECSTRRVERFVHTVDPAGYRHEIYFGHQEKYRSFQSAWPQHQGFMTGDVGYGHVVLMVPDAAAMRTFLMDILGFRLTDMTTGPMGQACFYRLNRRHHSLAVGEVPGTRALHHVMVQVLDVDDLGVAADKVAERIDTVGDLKMNMTLGRHSTDRMLSFYVNTPTGFAIEYGWGAVDIDEENWNTTRSEFPAEVWGHTPMNPGLPGSAELVEAVERA